MKYKLIASAIAAGVLSSSPVHAVAIATASMTGFNYTLVDQNLADGITPAISFTDERSSVFATAQGSFGAFVSDSAISWFTPVQAAVTSPRGAASAGVTTTSASATSTLSATGNPGSADFTQGRASPVQASFTITPNTAIIFSFVFDGSASTSLGRIGTDDEVAQASASIFVSIAESSGGQNLSAFRDVSARYVQTGNAFAGETRSFSGVVQLAYANLSSSSVNGFFYAAVLADSQSALPVPEPEGWVLMTSGLIGLGLWLRSRSAQA